MPPKDDTRAYEPVACPKCGQPNPPHAKYCLNCSHLLAKRAPPPRPRIKRKPTRMAKPMRGRGKLIVGMVAVVVVVASVGAYMFLTSKAPLSAVENENVRVGESQTYGIYVADIKTGSLTYQITGTATVENVECYVAQYSLSTGSAARSGLLKFDKGGNLRRATIAETENLSLKWRTEVGYSFADELMLVIAEDNRDPENYQEEDSYMNLTEEIMVPEHVWYLLRLESLHPGYRREFYINLLPDATLNVKAAFQVVGDEVVETQAGNFDCWVIEAENTQLTNWPIDKLWVAKDGGLVVKAIEWQDGTQIEYILESYV